MRVSPIVGVEWVGFFSNPDWPKPLLLQIREGDTKLQQRKQQLFFDTGSMLKN